VARILIVDDEPKLGRLLVEMLETQGHDVSRAAGGAEALARLARNDLDVVVTDLRMPDMDGMALLRAAKRLSPAPEVILMTAYASTENAVAAMRDGAVDYLVKPFAMDEFRLRVARVLERRELSARADALARRIDERQGFGSIVARSEAITSVTEQARRVARTDETVLLVGESGVGKTVIARAIHYASRRAAGPLVEVHCAALPESLLESELFGHERARSRAPTTPRPATLRRRTGARCSSTRSETSPWPRRSSCSASCRTALSPALVRRRPAAPTCA
jgi:DNA-binding NtrC family response regulator